MLKSRSVPTGTLLPHILDRHYRIYADTAEAIAWLTKAFG